MNFTVKDLAEYAGVTVKQMITDLTAKAPEVNWKATTPVPDNLVQLFMQNVDEYKSATPLGALTSTEGEGASIAQMRLNAEATQYALVETLGQVDMKDVITTAIAHSLGEIETYEATKAQVWQGYIDSRIKVGNERTTRMAGELKQQATKRQQGISNRMSAQTATKQTAQTALDEANAFLAQTLASM